MRQTFLVAALLLALPTVATAEQYPQEVRDAFMEACIQNGGNQEMCACVLNKIMDAISLSDLENGNYNEEDLTRMTEECLAGDDGSDDGSDDATLTGDPRCEEELAKCADECEHLDTVEEAYMDCLQSCLCPNGECLCEQFEP